MLTEQAGRTRLSRHMWKVREGSTTQGHDLGTIGRNPPLCLELPTDDQRSARLEDV